MPRDETGFPPTATTPAAGTRRRSILGGALAGLLGSWGWLSLADHGTLIWIGLIMVSFLLTIGLSWSHVRRRVAGQSDVDDIDQR